MSSDPADAPDPPQDTKPDPAPPPAAPQVKFTRAAALWGALIGGFLILIVLLIFVTQNMGTTKVQFLSWTSPSLPLGVLILLAAIGGGLVTVAVGSARIVQLRRAAKKLSAGR